MSTQWIDRLDPSQRRTWNSIATRVRSDEADAFHALAKQHDETASKRLRRLLLADLDAAGIAGPGNGAVDEGDDEE
jgi:hypothetical protein